MHAERKSKAWEAGLQTKQAFRVTFLTRGNGLEKGEVSVCLFIGEQQMWVTELSARTPKGFSLCQVKPVALCKPFARQNVISNQCGWFGCSAYKAILSFLRII